MLIEAAQHLGTHPGPLGHFFRRLAARKNRNVAVVAAARKLAAIAWRMLTTGEPYRYAIPRSTADKLARLRVRVTGQRRRGGPPAGIKATAKLPGGSRTISSLPAVCQREGLPAPQPLSRGEQHTLAQTDCTAFVAQIAAAQLVPRRTPRTPLPVAAPTGQASCPTPLPPADDPPRFRPPPAAEQGDEAPPPAPPTLSSVPEVGPLPHPRHPAQPANSAPAS